MNTVVRRHPKVGLCTPHRSGPWPLLLPASHPTDCIWTLRTQVSPPKESLCTQSCVADQSQHVYALSLRRPPPKQEVCVSASRSYVASQGAHMYKVARRKPRLIYVRLPIAPPPTGVLMCASLPAPILQKSLCDKRTSPTQRLAYIRNMSAPPPMERIQ